jgi:hypothetical protein
MEQGCQTDYILKASSLKTSSSSSSSSPQSPPPPLAFKKKEKEIVIDTWLSSQTPTIDPHPSATTTNSYSHVLTQEDDDVDQHHSHWKTSSERRNSSVNMTPQKARRSQSFSHHLQISPPGMRVFAPAVSSGGEIPTPKRGLSFADLSLREVEPHLNSPEPPISPTPARKKTPLAAQKPKLSGSFANLLASAHKK